MIQICLSIMKPYQHLWWLRRKIIKEEKNGLYIKVSRKSKAVTIYLHPWIFISAHFQKTVHNEIKSNAYVVQKFNTFCHLHSPCTFKFVLEHSNYSMCYFNLFCYICKNYGNYSNHQKYTPNTVSVHVFYFNCAKISLQILPLST